MSSPLKQNTTTIQDLLNTINSLPKAGGTDTSDATASANEILQGETAYVNGEKVTGIIETFDGSYECSGESTGGSGENVADEVDAYTEKLNILETAITALETELESKASGGGVATCTIKIVKNPDAWMPSDLRGLFFVAYENGEYKGYGGYNSLSEAINNLPNGFDFNANQNIINNVVCGSMIYIGDNNASVMAPDGFNHINTGADSAYFIVPLTPNATHTVILGI